MSDKTVKATVERGALVSAIKEINKELGMDPLIPTKTKKGEKMPAPELTALLLKYAKGFNDKTGEFQDDLKITRSDNLSDETFATLEAIGAFKSAKAEKKADKKDVKKGKEEKPAKAKKPEKAKKEPKAKKGDTRDKGILDVLTSFSGTVEGIVIAYDKLLIKKQPMKAHLAEAEELQKTLKKQYDLKKHIAYRTKYCGYNFAEEGENFFLNDIDLTKAQKFDVPKINVVSTGKLPSQTGATAPALPNKQKDAKSTSASPKKGKDKSKTKK